MEEKECRRKIMSLVNINNETVKPISIQLIKIYIVLIHKKTIKESR